MSKSRRGHGEGAIFKRESDGLWVARLDLGRDHTGKRKRAQRTARTKKEATAKLEELKRARIEGRPLAVAQPTVSEWLDTWLSNADLSPNSIATYRTQIERYIKPALGSVKLDQLQPSHVEAMTRGMSERGLSAATAKQARAILRRALHVAERHGHVHRNVAKLAEPPKGGHAARVDAMATDEALAVLEAAQGHRLEALAYVLLYLGLRKGEALALHWSDISGLDRAVSTGDGLPTNSVRPTLNINASLTRITGRGLVRSTTKTVGSQRTVPLVEPVLTKLREHRHRQAQERSGADIWFDKSIVFASDVGTFTDPRNALKTWHGWTERAGLGKWRMHSARHTAATLLLNSGQSMETVRAVLGHSNISTTADIYARVSEDSLRAAMKAAWGS